MTDPDLNLKPRLERLGDRVEPRTDAFDRLDRARVHRARGRRLGTIALAFAVAVAGTWGAFAAFRSIRAQPAGESDPDHRRAVRDPAVSIARDTRGQEPRRIQRGLLGGTGRHCLDHRVRQPLRAGSSHPDYRTAPAVLWLLGADPVHERDGRRCASDLPRTSARAWDSTSCTTSCTRPTRRSISTSGPARSRIRATLATPSPTGAAPENCDGISAPNAQIRFRNLGWDIACWNAPLGQPLLVRYLNRSVGIPSGLAIVPADTCWASIVLQGATELRPTGHTSPSMGRSRRVPASPRTRSADFRPGPT